MLWLTATLLSFAHSQPIIISSVYRFTAFTPALARLEYDPRGIFDDRATLAAAAPKQALHLDVIAVNATTSKLSTNFSDPQALTIWITHGGAPAPFSAANLRVENLAAGVRWDPSSAAPRNLNGTWVTSLDCYTDDPMDCISQYENNGRNGPGWTYGLGEGLLTRDGYTMYDDTHSVRLVPPTPPSKIPWWSNSTLDAQDWYINIYGPDFARALRDWVVVLGPPALPPKNSLGVWYSRYFPYSEQQLLDDVVGGYAAHDLPLSVLVSDMDWHRQPTDPNCSSWGQYDWNATLYPSCAPTADPACAGFLGRLHSALPPAAGGNALGHPLSLALNLHSNSGIDKCALRYPAFARAMGADADNSTFACDWGSEKWARALFDVYLDALPLGAGGLTYPWPDYNGCGSMSPPFVNSTAEPWARHYGGAQTLWATHVQAAHQELELGVRPLILSRHGGIGNHRVPFFFTGDTLQHEGHLDYQVKRTALAANVMVSVSHDIGGNHFPSMCQPAGVNLTGPCAGSSDPNNSSSSELFLRWMQHGVFSSVLRSHCDHCERRVWMYPLHARELFDALRLREALVPALYTAHREAVDTGVVPVHPVYYHFPALEEAYAFDHQYMFTRHVLVAPVTRVGGGAAAAVSVWLPPGEWVAWDGSFAVAGPAVDTRAYTPAQVPAFVPAMTLLPLKRGPAGGAKGGAGAATPDVAWALWLNGGAPAGSGSGALYEDDGVSLGWRAGAGHSALTRAAANASGAGLQFRCAPAEGGFPGMAATRRLSVQVRAGAAWAGRVASVAVNGVPVPRAPAAVPGWWVQTNRSLSGLSSPLFSLNVELGEVRLAEGAVVSVVLQQ